MKKILLYGTMALAALTVTLFGCKKPNDGLVFVLTSPEITSGGTVILTDAKTGDQIGIDETDFKIDIAVTGKDKDLVVNNQGFNKLKCINGMLSFGLVKGTAPTESNPVKFNIVFSKSGYITTSKSFTITDEGFLPYEVNMVHLTDLPVGVATIESTISIDGSGATTTANQIVTPTPQTSGEATISTLDIPAGTVMMDENMQPVSGTITAQMTYFSNQDEEAMKSFPGGFLVEADGQDMAFKTGGFVAVDMFAGQKEVKNFGSPINMTMEIPSNTSNYDGAQITDGMQVPIWSYEPSDGMWSKELDATITLNSSTQKYEVSFPMTHLSFYNVDWTGPSCPSSRILTMSSNIDSNLYLLATAYNGDKYITAESINAKNGSKHTFPNFPNGNITHFVFSQYVGGQTFNTTVDIPAGCGPGTLEGTFNVPKPIEIDLEYKCSDGSVFKPWMPVYFRFANGPKKYEFAGYMINGKVHTNCFYYGVPYKIATMIGDQYFEDPGTFTASTTYHKMVVNKCFGL